MFRWLRRLFAPTNPLLIAVRSPDPDIRRNAAEQLGSVPEPWALEELMRLLGDLSTPVREAARAGLQRQGAAAVACLIAGSGNARPEISVASVELLGDLPTTEVVEKLLLALKYAERPVQMAARRSLARCGSVAVPALRAALAENNPWLREQVAWALEQAESCGTRGELLNSVEGVRR